MKTGGILLLLAMALAYQLVALPLYRVGAAAPDFVFLALLYLAFFAPVQKLLLLAAVFTLGVDVLSLDPIGARAVGTVPALWMVSRARGWFVVDSPGLRWLLVFPAALLSLELSGAFTALLERGGEATILANAACAAYTTAMAIPVHGLLDRCRPRLGWVRDRYFA